MSDFLRRRRWRRENRRMAWVLIKRARAFNRGEKFAGCVPVYSEDASEENIQLAIRHLNHASWEHHTHD